MDMKRVSQKRVRKVLSFLLVFIMAFMLAGCGAQKDETPAGGTEKNGTDSAAMQGAADEAAPAEGGTEITGEGADTGAASVADDYSVKSEDDFASAKEPMSDVMLDKFDYKAEADIGVETPEELAPVEPGTEAKAGTLTAGEWDDNDNWGFYKNLFAKSSDYYTYKISWGMTFENRIRVKVTDGGNAVKHAKVSLLDKRKQVIWGSVSRYDGYADLFYATDKNNMNEPGYIKVEKDGKIKETELKAKRINVEAGADEDGQNPGVGSGNGIAQPSYEFDNEYTVELSGTKTNNKKLDIMFVVDTTGSMSDEITFLQSELKDVINTVKQNNSNIPIRISMNFYKDEGDSYVVDSHEFTSDIDEAQKLINAEYAEGGGDYPEAVHTALRDAVYNHKWDDDSVKVMFILLDAPPHDGVDESLADSLKKAGKEGIHIIPVAASGIDKKTEFLLRAMAVSTDGTYVFLTDDSGVGGSHIAPTVGDYDVELLNELMVRLINQYLGS